MIILKNYFTMFMLQMMPNTCNYVFKHNYEVEEVILLDLFLWNINIVIFTECVYICVYFFSLWRVLDVLYQPHLLITTGTFSKIVRIQYFLKYVAILLQLPVQISSHTHGHEGKWVTSVSCVASKLVQVESVWGQYFDLILFCNLLSFNCISMITCEIKFWH